MKKSYLLLLLIAFSLILFFKQNKISSDLSNLFHNRITNNKIVVIHCGIDNNQPVNKTKTKYFLKIISEKCFSLICHQDPSILIYINGDIIPLCPRCIGLHFGFIITFLVLTIFTKNRIRVYRSLSFIILITGLSIIGIEWFLAQFSIIQSTVLSRLLTGFVAGSVLGLLLIIYKSGFSLPVSSGHIIINASRIIGIISMSLAGGILIIMSNNWTFIDILLLISVTANFIIIIHTIIIRFKPFMQVLIIKI